MKKLLLTVLSAFICVMPLSCTKVESGNAGVTTAKKEETPAAPAKDAAAAPSIVFKVGSGGSVTLPQYLAMVEVFKPMVEEKSGGRIKVELYPASQLGDDVKLIEQLRSGTLESAIPVPSPLVGLVPELAIFDMPFLFSSNQMADKVLDGEIGKKLDVLMAEKGLINLGWGELGFRHVTNSKRDIRTPDDLKGLKLRTMENPIHIATWRALGVNATPMPVSEVFTAIQQGAIDGQENPVSAFYGWKIHEVNKHITLTGHVYSPNTVLVSKKIWDTYDQETKNILMEAGKASAKRSREIARSQESTMLKEMTDGGCTVIELTDAQKAPFQEATQSVWAMVEEKVGKDIFAEIKNAVGL
jgi:tripartite ATP-independent transporter DctP family solute receptor